MLEWLGMAYSSPPCPQFPLLFLGTWTHAPLSLPVHHVWAWLVLRKASVGGSNPIVLRSSPSVCYSLNLFLVFLTSALLLPAFSK